MKEFLGTDLVVKEHLETDLVVKELLGTDLVVKEHLGTNLVVKELLIWKGEDGFRSSNFVFVFPQYPGMGRGRRLGLQ